jgi:hypothetical protein
MVLLTTKLGGWSVNESKCPFSDGKPPDYIEPAAKQPVVPFRMLSRPLDSKRGNPVPWFVPEVDGEYDYRFMDGAKVIEALNFDKCWICGQKLGRNRTFIIGPMCVITRTTLEPPSHTDCAEWAVQVCPFLSNGERARREDEKTAAAPQVGQMIKRNPGVTCLWTTSTCKVFNARDGGMLLEVGEPFDMDWWKEGRAATAEEVIESIHTGLPAITDMCESMADHKVLAKQIEEANKLWIGFFNKKLAARLKAEEDAKITGVSMQ